MTKRICLEQIANRATEIVIAREARQSRGTWRAQRPGSGVGVTGCTDCATRFEAATRGAFADHRGAGTGRSGRAPSVETYRVGPNLVDRPD
jgi:hypothetical protein